MAIKSSGELSFKNDIVNEYLIDDTALEDNYPYKLGAYFRNRGKVPDYPENAGIPAYIAGQPLSPLRFSDFYDTTVTNQIEFNITSSDISGGSVNLYSKAQEKSGKSPANNQMKGPFVVTIKSGTTISRTCYLGGNFEDLTIIVESGAYIYGKGANGGSNSNGPGIYINSTTGPLTIINNGWIASGGKGGNSNTASATAFGSWGNHSVSVVAGGGGGQGGGSGVGSSAYGSMGAYSSSSSGSTGGYRDRIGSPGSVSRGSGGSGGSGGGGGGAATGAVQNNRRRSDGWALRAIGSGGGGSGTSPSSGGSGFAAYTYADPSGADNFKTASTRTTGSGGGSWGTGSFNAIHGTANSSSYTYSGSGTKYG